MSSKLDRYLPWITTAFAIVVALLGAYTRLADSGLGCPDWPGCYGHLTTVPQTLKEINQATQAYPSMPPLAPDRMWPEMIHRYFAGTLVLGVIFMTVRAAYFKRQKRQHCLGLMLAISALILFQAVLGMWTVTWKLLPLVVMGHLLGGFTLTACLYWAALLNHRSTLFETAPLLQSTQNHRAFWIMATVTGVVFVQIMLGGWTSANYAALICPDLPGCQAHWWSLSALKQGFNLFSPIGKNYEFGILGEHARAAIQMVHRWGALITSAALLCALSWCVKQGPQGPLKWAIGLTASVLVCQVLLGMSNIIWLLPMPVAVAHNGLGLLLLLCCLTLCFIFRTSRASSCT